MAILAYLVPISIVLLIVAIGAFAWAVRGGQFDDLDTPPLDILRDDDSDSDSGDSGDGDHGAAGRGPHG